MARQTR